VESLIPLVLNMF